MLYYFHSMEECKSLFLNFKGLNFKHLFADLLLNSRFQIKAEAIEENECFQNSWKYLVRLSVSKEMGMICKTGYILMVLILK